jgi:hypothetical protein
MEEFAVRDREGYVLGFGQPLSRSQERMPSGERYSG